MLEEKINCAKVQKRINFLAKKYKNKKIVLYGAGKLAVFLFEKCDFSKLNIVAIADKKFETEKIDIFLGYKTIEPEELKQVDCDLVLILNENYQKFIVILENLLINSKNSNIGKVAIMEPSKYDLFKEKIFSKKSNDKYANGHFYSPVPSQAEIEIYKKHKWQGLKPINLNIEKQEKLLEEYTELYNEFSFPMEKDPNISEFYLSNGPFFVLNDALSLNLFLRKFKPKNIIEVGSGYSTLCMVETKRISKLDMNITCIEPYPGRLQELVDTKKDVKLYKKKLQDIDSAEIVNKLDSGDFLFIDSSHVYKLGSDVMFLFKEILPNLKKGVYVHFHDIPYPFNYHDVWVEQGRYWNEAYILEQFLSYNNDWEIVFWPSMLMETSYEKAIKQIPDMQKMYEGGSIFLRKIG